MKCNYWANAVIREVYKLKHHLACTRTQVNVGRCKSVSDEVKVQMSEIVKS